MFKVYIAFCLLFLFRMGLYPAIEFIDNKDESTNEIRLPTILPTDNINEKYFVNTNDVNSFLMFDGESILKQKGVSLSDVNVIPDYKTSAFRHTEVTFIITALFVYTYASFAVLGLSTLENNFIIDSPLRNPYRDLNISTVTFEVVTGLACAAAVAYDSYMRYYGKKKSALSFSFVPYYDSNKEDAGFVFALSYPYRWFFFLVTTII